MRRLAGDHSAALVLALLGAGVGLLLDESLELVEEVEESVEVLELSLLDEPLALLDLLEPPRLSVL